MAIKEKLGVALVTTAAFAALIAGLIKRREEEEPPPPPPPPGLFTLEVDVAPVSGGSVTIEPDKDYYTKNEIVKLTAQAAVGYHFSHWTNALGFLIEESTVIRYPIIRNEVITAHFTTKPPPVPEYTKLVSWSHPGSAKAGTIITLTATVKNYAPQPLLAKVEGELLGHDIGFKPGSFTIGAGETKVTTSGSFSMPNRDIIVTITSFHAEDDAWIEDDSIELEIVVEPEEIEYEPLIPGAHPANIIDVAPAPTTGFTLRLSNVSPDLAHWSAIFAYPRLMGSPVMKRDEGWVCGVDPTNYSGFRVTGWDSSFNILFDFIDPGLVENGKKYVLNVGLEKLTTER